MFRPSLLAVWSVFSLFVPPPLILLHAVPTSQDRVLVGLRERLQDAALLLFLEPQFLRVKPAFF